MMDKTKIDTIYNDLENFKAMNNSMLSFCPMADFEGIDADRVSLIWKIYSHDNLNWKKLYAFSSDSDNLTNSQILSGNRQSNKVEYRFSGDTMNTFRTIKNKIICTKGTYEKCCDNLEKYRVLRHTIGNFITVPSQQADPSKTNQDKQFRGNQSAFNTRRMSACDDYWDLTMECLRRQFCHNMGHPLNNLFQDTQYPIYSNWIKCFGDGLDGWMEFIRLNYLDMYVDKNYNVVSLWTNEIINSEHCIVDLKKKRSNETDILNVHQFLQNVISKIKIRGQHIFDKL
jgi:hypothetical protein